MTTTLTTTLRVFDEQHPQTLVLETSDGDRIADELRAIGVRFERWAADAQLPKGADQQTVIDAYRSSIDKLASSSRAVARSTFTSRDASIKLSASKAT